jgi:hypothetical protein
VIVGSEPGRPRRSFEYTIDTGRVRPLTAEGVVGTLVSPDGRSLIAKQPDGTRVVLPIGSGTPRPVPGLDATDVVVRWAKDSRSLIVSGFAPGNGRTIVEVSLADGSRRTIATISPSDIAGLRRIAPPITSGDGQAYAYRYTQILSDLYVGEVR